MPIRLDIRFIIGGFLACTIGLLLFNAGLFAHIFPHPELYPDPFGKNHYIVGSTTMLIVILLLCSLAVHNRKLMREVKRKARPFLDLQFINADFKESSNKFDYTVHPDNSRGELLSTEEKDLTRKYQDLISDLKKNDLTMTVCQECSRYKDHNNEWHQVVNSFLKSSVIKLSYKLCPDCLEQGQLLIKHFPRVSTGAGHAN